MWPAPTGRRDEPDRAAPLPVGERPIFTACHPTYLAPMNPLLLIIILLLLFGGGGYYVGGPVYGGSGLGLILLICVIVWLFGGFGGGSKK